MVEQMANHCSAAGVLARRLDLNTDVQAGVEQSYARWDGMGELSGTTGGPPGGVLFPVSKPP